MILALYKFTLMSYITGEITLCILTAGFLVHDKFVNTFLLWRLLQASSYQTAYFIILANVSFA